MTRLKIVVEESGEESFEVLYVGHDATKAQEALKSPTSKRRALFNYPPPVQYNRPNQAAPAPVAAEVPEEIKPETFKKKTK